MTHSDSAERLRILIVHPEGNVFNNPNLHAIADLLGERYAVDVLVPVRAYNRGLTFTSENVQLIEYSPVFGDFRFICSREVYDDFRARYVHADYRLVIGVDRDGLILASLLSGSLGVAYGMISYEIFFQDETSDTFKSVERDASVDLDFVVVQDEVRGKHLIAENRIRAWVDVLFIPVAPANSHPYEKSHYLHQLLGIPEDRKILIFAGSITRWTCMDEVLKHANCLPDDWALVVHDRYNNASEQVKSLQASPCEGKVYVSDISVPTNADMRKLLHSADLGLALYKPVYTSQWTGKNIEFIGLGSGKISVYLQHGLPVVTTHSEVYTPLIKSHGLGYVLNDTSELIEVLEKHESRPEQHARCVGFFEEHLSLKVYEARLMDAVQRGIDGAGQPRFFDIGRMLRSLRESLDGTPGPRCSSFSELCERVEEIRQTGKKLVVYGADALGLTVQSLMPENVIAFVDPSSGIISTSIVQGGIYSPRNLPNMDYDGIIVGTFGPVGEIVDRLVNELGVLRQKLLFCPDAVRS